MPKVKRGPKPSTAANSRIFAGARIWSDDATRELSPNTRREFDRLVEVLRRAGVLEKTDFSVVLNAARLHDLIDRAYVELEDIGLVLVTENLDGETRTKANPMLNVINSLSQRHRAVMNDLGLTPASCRLTKPAPDEDDDDPITEFLTVG